MNFIDQVHLGILCVITFVVVACAFEGGFHLGLRARNKDAHTESIGSMVQATLGMLAFLLAFTFGLAAERFNDRRTLVIEEANAFRTAYMRASFLPEKTAYQEKELVREYVDDRLMMAHNAQSTIDVGELDSIPDLMWAKAMVLGKETLDSDLPALFMDSLNQTMSLQSERVAAEYTRIPESVWITLYVMTILGMAAMGYQCGGARTRSLTITTSLVLSLTVVIIMIADLDRPREGFLQTNETPFVDLAQKIGKPSIRHLSDLD